MSYYPSSPSNQTGLGYAREDAKDDSKKSDVTVMVTERQGAAPEKFTLTTAQEAFAQKIARTGQWEEMPHSSGRRQIRQRVLDILKGKGAPAAASSPKTASGKPKTEYVFVLTRTAGQDTEVVATPRLKSQAKDLAASEVSAVDEDAQIAWVNDKENATGTVVLSGHTITYSIVRKTLLKPKA